MAVKTGQMPRVRVLWRFIRALMLPFVTLIAFHAVVATVYVGLEGISWLEAVYWVTHPHAIDLRGHVRPVTRAVAIFVYASVFFFQVWFAERVLVTLFGHGGLELWSRLMSETKIEQMRDHFIICGYGQVGRTVVDQLQKASLPFVLIELDEGLYKELLKEGLPVIHGDARRRDVLLQAGIQRARGIAIVIDNDADTLYITITARLLNPNIYIISRAGNLRYAEALRGAGANEVFIPEYEGGLIVWRSIERLVGPTGRLE